MSQHCMGHPAVTQSFLAIVTLAVGSTSDRKNCAPSYCDVCVCTRGSTDRKDRIIGSSTYCSVVVCVVANWW